MEYQDYKLIAIKVLHARKQKLTDENIGMVISAIATADYKYNPKIGNLEGFRKMYIDFAFKTRNQVNKKFKRIKTVDDYGPFLDKKTCKTDNSNIFWKDLEIILTEKEYSIILMKYVFNESLANIGKKFDLTAERIRQILEISYNKIRKRYKYV